MKEANGIGNLYTSRLLRGAMKIKVHCVNSPYPTPDSVRVESVKLGLITAFSCYTRHLYNLDRQESQRLQVCQLLTSKPWE